uniref:Uncharacterized protein n=1 Tax=Solanum tuberosum TaxID=4113 RepID=M1DL31_SOLTU
MSEDIISTVEKRKKEALGKEKKKPKTRKAPVRKVVDSKKGEKKEPVKRRVKETTKKKRKVSPDTNELFAASEPESEKIPAFGLTVVNIRGSDARIRVLRVSLNLWDDFRPRCRVKETSNSYSDGSIESGTLSIIGWHI